MIESVARPRRFRRAALVVLLGAMLVLGCEADRSEPRARPVVVVVLDALRADHVGAYGYARQTTPRIDAFAAESVRYETAISDASFTFLAVGSLMSALSPSESGLSGRTGGRVPAELELLAEVAKASGFGTGAYSENPHVTRYFGLDQGFDDFEEAFPVADYSDGRELAPDHDSAARIRALFDRIGSDPGRPFLAYLHLLRPHNPYRPSAPFAGRFDSDPQDRDVGSTERLLALDRRGPPFDPGTIEALIALYDENLAQGDALFGVVLDELALRSLDSEAIVILTADHGEAFGEHGRLLHSTQLHDPMIRIPMVVRVPGEPARVEAQPVQLSDLGRALQAYLRSPGDPRGLHALVDLAGARRGLDSGEAGPLFSWTAARSHLVSARTPTRKLVLDAQSLEVVAHHDLASDPDEHRSLPLDEEGERLRALLEQRIARWTGVTREHEQVGEVDETRRRQLEALGYEVPESARKPPDGAPAAGRDATRP